MQILVTPLYVEESLRIGIRNSQFYADFPNKMKKIIGARWSPDQKCWHIPYTPDAWSTLVHEFSDFEVIRPVPGPDQLSDKTTPKPPEESKKTRTTRNDYPPPTFRRPMDQFAIYPSPGDSSKLWLHLPATWCDEYLPIVKRIHGRRWNMQENLWELPYTQLTIRFINKYIGNKIKWTFEIQKDIPEGLTPVPTDHFPKNGVQESFIKARYEEAVTALKQYMLLKNYRHTTIKSYINCFRSFIRHYDDIKPSQITRKQMDIFIASLLTEKRISRSYQSQILSALKMFYTSVVNQPEKVATLFYPRRAEKLPNVLTEAEVSRFLQKVDNIKHRCIMMLIYSGGL